MFGFRLEDACHFSFMISSSCLSSIIFFYPRGLAILLGPHFCQAVFLPILLGLFRKTPPSKIRLIPGFDATAAAAGTEAPAPAEASSVPTSSQCLLRDTKRGSWPPYKLRTLSPFHDPNKTFWHPLKLTHVPGQAILAVANCPWGGE